MAKFVVNKNKNFTIMSNYHLKEKNMSLKAKGLLSVMLSLPEDWDYSIAGLVSISLESETAIKNTLSELKKNGYLKIIKLMPNESKNGRIDYIYNIYEKPKQEGEKQGLENLPLENQSLEILGLENQRQINKDNKILNINNLKSNTNNIKEKINKKENYGIYNRIKLTASEYLKLVEDYGKEFIDKQIELLDEYVESNNNKNKYTNFNLVLRKSIRDNWFKSKKVEKKGNNVFLDIMQEDYESIRKNN